MQIYYFDIWEFTKCPGMDKCPEQSNRFLNSFLGSAIKQQKQKMVYSLKQNNVAFGQQPGAGSNRKLLGGE